MYKRQGLGREALERNRALIEAWDAMSLALCMPRLPDGFDGVPAAGDSVRIEMDLIEEGTGLEGPRLVAVDPWPFDAPSVDLSAQGRVLGRRYEERAEMQAALAAAEIRPLAVTLVPR